MPDLCLTTRFNSPFGIKGEGFAKVSVRLEKFDSISGIYIDFVGITRG